MSEATAAAGKAELGQAWLAAWPEALAAWSHHTQLRAPVFHDDEREAAADGMLGQIAAIRLTDQRVMVNLLEIARRGLEDCALPILAHEIGHHVYVPANLADNARMIAAIKRVFFNLPRQAVLTAANLYGDLLINDRLHRRVGIDMVRPYRILARDAGGGSRVWRLYTRTYEHLWRIERGALGGGTAIDEQMDGDALLLARLVRSFAGDWGRGARRFATILYAYFVQDATGEDPQTFEKLGLADTKGAGAPRPGEELGEAIPDGLTEIDASELDDGELEDDEDVDTGKAAREAVHEAPSEEGRGTPGAQHREPFQYGELLRALGLDLDAHAVTTRYYRERALPHLIPFPSVAAPQVFDPIPEGYEDWQPGDPVEALDPIGSVVRSPVVVPGITTVRRVYGDAPGHEPRRQPVDLDIYVDSSGSMPDPANTISYLALAATILSLSALRAGARVQATLWSGAGQFRTTGGFTREEGAVLGVVTGCLAGATCFPLHLLRDTYADRKPSDPAVHLVVISDNGADTMLQRDERGGDGAELCAAALAAARGGGTLVLNLFDRRWPPADIFEKMGFAVHAVTDWDQLVAFARQFVRRTYGSAA